MMRSALRCMYRTLFAWSQSVRPPTHGRQCWRWLALVGLCVLALTAPPAAQAEPAGATPAVIAVHIVSRVGVSELEDTSAPADLRPKRARADVGVTLHAVLEVRDGRRTRFYSDAERIRLGRRLISTSPMATAPPVTLTWYKVEPKVEHLSNTASGRFRFEEIPYGETEVAAWRGRATVAADVRPTLTTDRGLGVGTMRYKLVADTAAGSVVSPGAEARAKRGGGLDLSVHRVSLRRDDSYLGMLTELFGQPYIWASGGQPARRHQSEALEGADCADFVVYGWRRLGHRVEYTWSAGLREHTELISAGSLAFTGVHAGAYVDRQGRALAFTQPGDILLFPRHVGVLVADRGQLGVLDPADIMMHTLYTSPREQSIIEAGYGFKPVEIRRWNKPRRARSAALSRRGR